MINCTYSLKNHKNFSQALFDKKKSAKYDDFILWNKKCTEIEINCSGSGKINKED